MAAHSIKTTDLSLKARAPRTNRGPEGPARRRLRSIKNNGTGYLFLAPMLLAMSLFTLYPLVETIRLSFTNSNGVSGSYVGLTNYRYVLGDNVFWQALINTVYMGLGTLIIGIPISLVIAGLINSLPAAQSLFKALYFVPNITSAIAAAIAFMYVFYPTGDGWVNAFLSWFGIGPFRWFADPGLARVGVILMSVWHGLGYLTLIWLAGLQTVSRELKEAAQVDGASAMRRWWYVTLPALRPITTFIVTIEIINGFKRFADVYQIGGADGEPGGSLATVMVYIYRVGFNSFAFGQAAAASTVTFAIIIAVTFLNLRLFRERD